MVLILFQIGLPGVALVLTYGQLVSQIFVEEFTLQFFNLPGCEFVVRLSLGKAQNGVNIRHLIINKFNSKYLQFLQVLNGLVFVTSLGSFFMLFQELLVALFVRHKLK